MLKLGYKTLKSVVSGAARVEESDGKFRFYRFTEEQEEVYKKYHDDLLIKTFSTSGVCLEFKTDSTELYIEYDLEKSSSRGYYAFDILCDGKPAYSIANFEEGEKPFEREFILSPEKRMLKFDEGIKTIKIVFPWSALPIIKVIGLEDGSMIEPVSKKEKLIMFGDSITHGYDAIHPTQSYAYRISSKLNLEVYNKGIGGEVFFPELAECKDDFEPKYITVAYGTNDWSHCPYDEFAHNSRAFFDALTKNYPNAKIFALTPIWRGDHTAVKPMGAFETVKNHIFELAEKHSQVIAIDGYNFVPHDEKYYADLTLHPNSDGFEYYAQNLYEAIKKYL